MIAGASLGAVLVCGALLGARARRLTLAGTLWLSAVIGPAVAVTGHNYSYLLYLALPGVALIATPVLEALGGLLGRWRPKLVPVAVVALAAAMAAVGIGAAFITEQKAVLRPGHWSREHFVLRRALIAERVLDQLTRDMTTVLPSTVVVFVSGDAKRNWWDANFSSALGQGAALRVHFNRPGLDVRFIERGTSLADLSGRQTIIYEYVMDGTIKRLGTGRVRPGARIE
jgi:hypothetical protein